MDLVLKLRELRRLRGLKQKEVARRSGIGVKTISSFETGERIGSMKFEQLVRLLEVYETTLAEFFSRDLEKDLAPWALDQEELAERRLLEEVGTLPKPVQRTLYSQFQLMVETAAVVYANHLTPQPVPFEQEHSRSRRY